MRCVADMYCIYWYDTNSLEEYTQTWTAVRNQGIILRIGYASSMTQWNHGLLPHICAFVGLTASTITVFCGTFRKSSRAVGPAAWDWWTPGDQKKITQRVNASLPQHACDNGRKCWKKLISAGCHMTFGHIHSWTITLFQSNIVSVSTIIYILVCTVLLWNYRWLVVWNAAIPFEMRIPIDEDMFHGHWNYERDDYTPWLSPLYPSIIPLYPRGFLWIISHEHHKSPFYAIISPYSF